MTWIDYAAIAVAGVSVALGVWRGIAREVFSLAGWVAAVGLALLFAEAGARWIPASLAAPVVRYVVVFAAIFLAVLIGSALLGVAIAKLLRVAGLGIADRMLGGVFGFARGALILVLAALAAGLTPLPEEPVWRESAVTGTLEAGVIAMKPWLPDKIAARIGYK